MKQLLLNGWWDEGDPESLIYFEIYDGNKKIWNSSWHDIREFCEDKVAIKELRQEVNEGCQQYGINVNLSSDDYNDWEMI